MAIFVFCPAWGIHQAPTHHIDTLGFHKSLMYLMNEVALGQMLAILSSCVRVKFL